VAGAQLFDDVAVDLDPSIEDDLFGFAAAGDTGLRKDLLEAVALRSFLGLINRFRCHIPVFLTAGLLIAVVDAALSIVSAAEGTTA
jgi:hypothetical protein